MPFAPSCIILVSRLSESDAYAYASSFRSLNHAGDAPVCPRSKPRRIIAEPECKFSSFGEWT
jgi:hypothetical protein